METARACEPPSEAHTYQRLAVGFFPEHSGIPSPVHAPFQARDGSGALSHLAWEERCSSLRGMALNYALFMSTKDASSALPSRVVFWVVGWESRRRFASKGGVLAKRAALIGAQFACDKSRPDVWNL